MYRQHNSRLPFGNRRRERVLVFIFIFFFLFFLVVISLCFFTVIGDLGNRHSSNNEPLVKACKSETGVVYDIVIDAGSTGTRIHIFKYRHLRLVTETFNSTRPGLSSFANDLDSVGVEKLLNPLIKTAIQAVPTRYHTCTHVVLMATAGLRLISPEKGELLMSVAEQYIRQESKFLVDHTTIITGEEEGISAWFTLSYLLKGRFFIEYKMDNIMSQERLASIDMGGASVQIVLPLLPQNVVEMKRVSRVNLDGNSIDLYRYSFLGLGLKEASKLVMEKLLESERSAFPCFPTDYQQSIESVNGLTFTVENTQSDLQKFNSCAHLFNFLMNENLGEHQAAFSEVRSFFSQSTSPSNLLYAFSYFYDRIQNFEVGSTVTVGTYKIIGEKLCHEGAKQNIGTMCMDFAYLYTFLSLGLGLQDETILNVPKKLRNVEVSWALGASLQRLKRRS